jgi:ribokinase
MLKYCVIGSLNYDLIINCPIFPKMGQTIIGDSLSEIPGGKGGNQAMAIAKLGGNVSFLGNLGNDNYGKFYLKELNREGINTSNIIINNDNRTGIGICSVDYKGNSQIIVIPGANYVYDSSTLERWENSIKESDVFLLQNEINSKLLYKVIDKIREYPNKIIILDASPAMDFDESIYAKIDYLTCSRGEAKTITSINPQSRESAKECATWFLSRGLSHLIIYIDKEGIYYFDKTQSLYSPTYKNIVHVDSTGAGDSFNGAFALSLEKKFSIREALWFSQAVAAISITKTGAQTALPSFEEAMELYANTIPNFSEL